MTWVVKNDDGHYLTETTPGTAYFSECQRFAIRFDDQGKAYRVARRWDCGQDMKVVRLLPKRPPTRFKAGDLARERDGWPGELPRIEAVKRVAQEWVGGEWREYLQFQSGAGNADLFDHVRRGSPSESVERGEP